MKSKRFLTVGVVALLVLGLSAAAVFAQSATPAQRLAPGANVQINDKQKSELTALRNQMLTIREQMIDKYVEYGWMTADQAKLAKDRIAIMKKNQVGAGFPAGAGCFGRGAGRRGPQGRGFGGGMMGFGGGYPGMMGGWAQAPASTPAQQ